MTPEREAELMAMVAEGNRAWQVELTRIRASLRGTQPKGGHWTHNAAGAGEPCVEQTTYLVVTKPGEDRGGQITVRTRCAGGVRASDLAIAFAKRRGAKVHYVTCSVPSGWRFTAGR